MLGSSRHGNRRKFLTTCGVLAAASSVPFDDGEFLEEEQADAAEPDKSERKRLAVVTTIYRRNSHSDHIAGRYLTHYMHRGKPVVPGHRVVSMYVEQVGSDDLSQSLAAKHGFRPAKSIAEALMLGTDELAVDGILLIGEHGDYPNNEYGQKLYPRYEYLSQIVDVFRKTGRSVPVFNDKHLSWSGAKAKEMVDWSRELKFPLQAGSSLPVTWRRPELELPLGTKLEEALVVAFSDPEIYGFHALETLQCHVERRAGGESGVKSVQTLKGDDVWAAAEMGVWSKDLYEACLSRSWTVKPGRPEENVSQPHAYRIEYRDGFQATVLMLDNHVGDFTFAAKAAGKSEPVSCLHVLPNPPRAGYFDALVYNIERMFQTGKAVVPIERTQLVSGVLEKLLHSRAEKSRRLQTPELAIAYKASEDSGYYRGPISTGGARED